MIRRRRRTPDDFDNEVRAHLAHEADRLTAEGWTAEAAAAEARRRFGNIVRVREDFFESTRLVWLDRARSDAGTALRSMARYPLAALVAIFSLAGGIGGATVTLALRDTLYYLPPPLYAEPSSLSVVRVNEPERRRGGVPWTLYRSWTDRAGLAGAMAAAGAARPADLRLVDRTESTVVRSATAELFTVLGVAPVLGTGFAHREPGGPSPAILSHRQWRRFFDGRADAIGTSVWINGVAHTIVGVLPEHFWYAELSEPIWTVVDPFTIAPDAALDVVVRRDGATSPAALAARLQPLATEYGATQPPERRGVRVDVRPMIGTPIGEAMGPIPGLLVGAAVLFTLLIGCTNVAVLMMAQWTAREHELAIRASIGASRARLVQTLVTESMLLAASGGMLGVVVTLVLRGLVVQNGGEFTAFNLSIRPGVFITAAAIVLLVGVIAGLAPALHQVRRHVGHPLASLRTSDRVRQRWRHALVAIEIAVTVGLLVVAGTLVSAAQRRAGGNAEFDRRPLLSFRVQNPRGVAVDRIVAHLGALPGVQSAAASTAVPLSAVGAREPVSARAAGETHTAERAQIGAGFLATLGVALREGRDFATAERGGLARAVLINEVLAARLWPGAPAVGQTLWTGGQAFDVIGVVRDYSFDSLRRPEPMFFVPLPAEPPTEMPFLVRAATSPGQLRDVVRREITALSPGNIVTRAFGLQEIAEVGAQELLATGIPLMPLIAVAMLLTSAGVYGVLSFAVARRSTELAVRMAVGATRGHILRSLAGQSARVVAAGLIGGLLSTLALTRVAQGAGGIFDSPGWAAFLVPLLIVSVIGVLATWLPARRAMRIEPSQLLRSTGA